MPEISRVERDDFAEAIHSHPRPRCCPPPVRGIIIVIVDAVGQSMNAAPHYYCSDFGHEVSVVVCYKLAVVRARSFKPSFRSTPPPRFRRAREWSIDATKLLNPKGVNGTPSGATCGTTREPQADYPSAIYGGFGS